MDTATAHGGGVYDELVGVTPAKEFTESGTTSSAAGKFTVMFPSPGKYRVQLDCVLATGESVSHEDTVDSFYVRRELRELTDRDRNLFLDTFMTLYNTGAAEGVKSFGTHFKPLTYFEKMHLDAAAGRLVDHIHDGMGVLTQHMALTAEFELVSL